MRISKALLFFFALSVSTLTLYASAPQDLAKKLHLIAGKKAIIQWERVFKSNRKMKKYGIDKLSKEEKVSLKNYLLDHAADSDHPTVAGM